MPCISLICVGLVLDGIYGAPTVERVRILRKRDDLDFLHGKGKILRSNKVSRERSPIERTIADEFYDGLSVIASNKRLQNQTRFVLTNPRPSFRLFLQHYRYNTIL
mmetsp:Transcript_1933/g.4090  ORF Transcript_1933/g.4090 Transcript_1933/m.4090 type:complete len:106 (+) Transcript_1933:122-439(+)